MNNSYITIIKEKRTALSRKRIPLNQNGCTANFRIGVPFEQNLHLYQRSQGTIYRYDQPICKRRNRKTIRIPTGRCISGNQEKRKEQSENRGDKGGQCGKAGMDSDS